jgi:glycosyltransferase involved in cell wall biosynthesis
MKILVGHNFYQQPGGEDQCVAAEVAMLRAYGHEVVEYSLHNDAINEMSRLRMVSDTLWSRSSYQQVRALMRRHRPAIAHFHNTFPLISPAAYYAAHAENVAVVQTLHNFRLLCPNALFFRAGRVCEDCLGRSMPWPAVVHQCYRASRSASAAIAAMVATHRALRTWWKAVDLYIALTEFGRAKFIAGGLPAGKIVVKSHFVYPDPGPGTGSGGFALFVGRLSAEKGVATLLDAWKNLAAPLRLKIVGDGPLADTVVRAAADDPRIEWLGHKPSAEVYALIGEALCLLSPSGCYETFGRVLIEAFAKGTPVIASNLGAMAELVDHGRTGLHFEPNNAGDLAAQVQRLSGDTSMRAQLARAARQEYMRKYGISSNYRTLMASYKQALGASPLQREKKGMSKCGTGLSS